MYTLWQAHNSQEAELTSLANLPTLEQIYPVYSVVVRNGNDGAPSPENYPGAWFLEDSIAGASFTWNVFKRTS